jgi:hypothetical protein
MMPTIKYTTVLTVLFAPRSLIENAGNSPGLTFAFWFGSLPRFLVDVLKWFRYVDANDLSVDTLVSRLIGNIVKLLGFLSTVSKPDLISLYSLPSVNAAREFLLLYIVDGIGLIEPEAITSSGSAGSFRFGAPDQTRPAA